MGSTGNVKESGTYKLSGKLEEVKGLTFGMARITNDFIDIDGYSNKVSEKAMLNELAKAVEPYDKNEADGIRDMVKFNEIEQFPGGSGGTYIIEWEPVDSATRIVDADGVPALLSKRNDVDDNYDIEDKKGKWYVHVRFAK